MKAKGVQRIDHRHTHGFQARVWDGLRMHTKMFSDGVWGGREAAFYAALRHRNETTERLGLPVTERPNVFNPARVSRSGVRGVSRAVKKTRRAGRVWSHVVYRVVWFPEPRKRRVKDFYAKGGDERAALERAAAFRRAREAETRERGAGAAGADARGLVPSRLPPELREEVCQEIALAVLEGSLLVGELDARAVRGIIRRVSRGYGDPFRHVSLEHPVGDGLRLEAVLEG